MKTIDLPDDAVVIVVGRDTASTKVYAGGEQIALVQHLYLEADAKDLSPSLTVSFPDIDLARPHVEQVRKALPDAIIDMLSAEDCALPDPV